MDKQTIKKIILQHKDILRKNKVKSIALFGSYVRGEQRENSDVDLLVEFGEVSYDNYINLIYSLESILKKTVSVVTPAGISPYVKPYVLKELEKIEG
jgi:predicted nucleotidyltransferase